MSQDTNAAPLTEAPPPRGLRTRFDELRLFARRHRLGSLVTVGVVFVTVGLLVGRATAPGPEADARLAVETHVLPLVLDADSIWTSGVSGSAPISDALLALSRDGDPDLVREHEQGWLDAYDAALVRMAGLDLPPTARPVQRQYMAALTFSRDAVEVLARAARTPEGRARDELVVEADRLRRRSEQLVQAARASTTDLDGSRTDVSPLPTIPGFG